MSKTVKAIRTEFVLNNEDYRMDKYKSRAVLVFKKVDGVYDFVSAKQVIRLKLEELDPENYSMENTKNSNTRFLGNKLSNMLNK